MAERDQQPRALVLGATGFIGSWIARVLAGRNVPATLVARDGIDGAAKKAEIAAYGEILEQDLAFRDGVLGLIRETQPSVIFNLAAYGVRPDETLPEQAYLINEQLVSWLVEALTVAAGRGPAPTLIHVGSAAEYGEHLDLVDENTPQRPTSLYGASKLAGTRVVANASQRGLPAMCARLFMVYGPGEPSNRLVPSLIAAARSGDTLKLSAGSQRRDFTYVEDVADALLRLAALPLPRAPVVNVATGRTMTVRKFAGVAARVLGLSPDQLSFGASDVSQGMDYGSVDVSLLRTLTGWSPPTDVEQGLRNTATAAGLSLTH